MSYSRKIKIIIGRDELSPEYTSGYGNGVCFKTEKYVKALSASEADLLVSEEDIKLIETKFNSGAPFDDIFMYKEYVCFCSLSVNSMNLPGISAFIDIAQQQVIVGGTVLYSGKPGDVTMIYHLVQQAA